MAHPRFVFLALGIAALVSLFSVSASFADPEADLAEAEAQRSAAQAEVSSAERSLKQAEQALAPVSVKAEAADKKVRHAEAELDRLKNEVTSERVAAARQMAAAEQNYDDEKSSRDSITGAGILIALLAIVAAVGAFAYSRFRRWPLSKTPTQLLAGALGVVFIGGVALAAAASTPSAPEFSRETLELASDARGNPLDPPTPEFRHAQAVISGLTQKAKPLDAAKTKAGEVVTRAEGDIEGAESKLASAESNAHAAENEIAHLEAIAEEEDRFREEATTIDYKQLIKNADAYKGEKVVYTGQVFQIQEEAGFGVMLLSVTDEGYGFWTDNIWVEFDEPIEAAEEDIITVYGKITGSEEYETQIGGSTYVPRMHAKYIDE